jgi:hypothetical protein
MKEIHYKELPEAIRVELKVRDLRINSYRYFSKGGVLYVVSKKKELGLCRAITHIKNNAECELQILNTGN